MQNYWYTFSKEDREINEFLDMFWSFHDFRIVDIIYKPERDIVAVVFEYDDRTMRVLLEFHGEVCLHVLPVDFEFDWIMDACVVIDGKQYKWIQCEKEVANSLNYDVTYFKGNEIRWAMVDKSNVSIELPQDMLHQHFVNSIEKCEWNRDFSPVPADNQNEITPR